MTIHLTLYSSPSGARLLHCLRLPQPPRHGRQSRHPAEPAHLMPRAGVPRRRGALDAHHRRSLAHQRAVEHVLYLLFARTSPSTARRNRRQTTDTGEFFNDLPAAGCTIKLVVASETGVIYFIITAFMLIGRIDAPQDLPMWSTKSCPWRRRLLYLETWGWLAAA